MTVFQPQETQTQTPTQSQDSVFILMSKLRADHFGWEDIYVRLKAAGFNVSRGECRRFVIPQTHGAHRKGQATGGR